MPPFTLSKVFFLAAFVFALLATLAAGGVIATSLVWCLPAAATALAAAFLVA